MDRLRLVYSTADALRPAATGLRMSELIGALSHALDLTEGQPRGHCVRCCWIGMHVGRALGLGERELWELYYTLLLKDLGCSSNAARICELYLADDRQFKHDFKTAPDGLPGMLRFVFAHTGISAGMGERLRALFNIALNGPRIAHELIETRCQRGADIARQLRFPEAVARGIHALDEHWNGQGRPEGLHGDTIPLYARIALLAQVVDVFRTAQGPQAALAEVRARAGRWFDPSLVDVLERVARLPGFWRMLDAHELDDEVRSLEPAAHQIELDDDWLDDITAAFGQVVDAKSPYTHGHSSRVADYADRIAATLGLDAARRRWLRRGALLHDVGKLGVSNLVLDKPGRLDPQEWAQVRQHAQHTEAILSRIGAFATLAPVAAAHHERLDGTGYPHGLGADQIRIETRIITVADIFDAISATRPYRAAVPIAQTMQIMAEMAGTAVDPVCLEALHASVIGPMPVG